MRWQTGRFTHDLTGRGLIMGILNVTPDSFSDGGDFLDVERAVEHALAMRTEGATIIDVGGESTRPGAPGVSVEEERRRVVPVVRALQAAAPECVVSVDTSKPEVARAAIAVGAAVINDVTALRGDPAMAEVIARSGVGLILMHMQGEPRTMQRSPAYTDVVAEVAGFFEERRQHALAAGIEPSRLAFDPGIGFGKTVDHNLSLLRALPRLAESFSPLVLGVSRKSFLARVTGTESMSERLWPTLALTALLRRDGARILRVHDVRANLAALRMAEALLPDECAHGSRRDPVHPT